MIEIAARSINFLDFSHGILCGIAHLGTQRGRGYLLRDWDFFDAKSSIAAEAAYQYLQLRPDCKLEFAIFRDRMYGQSDVWEAGVHFEWVNGTIRPFSPLGMGRARDFFVDPIYNDLDFLDRDPEEREMWIDCAWVFANAYGRFRD